ncbi:MAG TPA: hypothetical protein VFG50_14845 [Rhodothermales bacterium]|nr:hypothetical protein [Rhodothermales bacterium]
MVIIRGTKKLLKRMAPITPEPPASTTRLGDWTGNLYGVGHQRYVLFIAERTRLPVVIPARGLKNVEQHLSDALGKVLQALGIPLQAIRAEQQAMSEAAIAPTNSRSLLSTMNDLGYALRIHLTEHPHTDLVDLALWLADTPIGPKVYTYPDRETKRLFATQG